MSMSDPRRSRPPLGIQSTVQKRVFLDLFISQFCVERRWSISRPRPVSTEYFGDQNSLLYEQGRVASQPFDYYREIANSRSAKAGGAFQSGKLE